MKLSILIPAYNEEPTLAEAVELVQAVDLSVFDMDKEIIIVDDGSTDSTYAIMKRLSNNYPNIKIFQHRVNIGKGGAIRTAIQKATGDILIVQDADLEYDPNDYHQCIKPIVEGKAKVVYGSRLMKKENYEGKKKTSFFFGGLMVTLAFNIIYFKRMSDEPTCYKTFHKDVIKGMEIKSNRFEWEPELTAKIFNRGYKIYEVPISYFPRTEEEGKHIRWIDGVKAVVAMIRFRFSK